MGASKVETPYFFISQVGNVNHQKLAELQIPGFYPFNNL